MSSNYEVIEVLWKFAGFKVPIIRVNERSINNKLAIISNGSGTLRSTEYNDFLGSTCLVDQSKIVKFFEYNNLSQERTEEAASELRALIIKVNPLLDPELLVINEDNVIRLPEETDDKIRNLVDNPLWDAPPDLGDDVPPELSAMNGMFLTSMLNDPDLMPRGDHDNIEVIQWDRINTPVAVKKFNKNSLVKIFSGAPDLSEDKDKYKLFLVAKCVVDYNQLFIYIDRLAMEKGVAYEMSDYIEDLYAFCIEVNPFLAWSIVDFNKITKIRNKERARSVGAQKEIKEETEESAFYLEDVPKEKILNLSESVKKKLIGQDEIVDEIVETIQIAYSGLKEPEPPMGVFLLTGRTGTGKTYAAKVLAEELCGRFNMIRLDCTEYSQSHEISKLTGAPAGYTGHDEGGYLTNFIKDKPFSVVLFDEVEKAHGKLHDILLQIMDDGRLTSGKGECVHFDNTLVLMTSNVGVRDVDNIEKTIGFPKDVAEITDDKQGKTIKEAIKTKFKPEFINRIDRVLVFNQLDKECCRRIIQLQIENINSWLKEKEFSLTITQGVENYILEKGFDKAMGARPLKRFIRHNLIKPLSKKILMDDVPEKSKITAKMDKKGNIVFKITKPRKRKGDKK